MFALVEVSSPEAAVKIHAREIKICCVRFSRLTVVLPVCWRNPALTEPANRKRFRPMPSHSGRSDGEAQNNGFCGGTFGFNHTVLLL